MGLRLVLWKRGGVHLRKHEELESGLCAVKGLLLLLLRDEVHCLWTEHSLCECLAGRHALIASAGPALVSEMPCKLCRRLLACNAEAPVASPAHKATNVASRHRGFAGRTAKDYAGAVFFVAL